MDTTIKSILSRWRSDPAIAENVVEWRLLAQKPAETCPIPATLSAGLATYLQTHGIPSLYNHQCQAYERAMAGSNIAIVSGTASGKTLCYNLPVLDSLVKQPNGSALFLFPTKALAQDQLVLLREMT